MLKRVWSASVTVSCLVAMGCAGEIGGEGACSQWDESEDCAGASLTASGGAPGEVDLLVPTVTVPNGSHFTSVSARGPRTAMLASYTTPFAVGGAMLPSFIGSGGSALIISDVNGIVTWTRAFVPLGTSSQRRVSASAARIDGSGNVVVTGTFNGSANFGFGVVTTPTYSTYGFVAKYQGETGAPLWAQTFASGNLNLSGLAIAPDDSIAVSGSLTESSVTIAGTTLTPVDPPSQYAEAIDGLVIRLRADGVATWARLYGGTPTERITAITFDAIGRLVFAGVCGAASFDVGGGQVACATGAPNGAFIVAIGNDNLPAYVHELPLVYGYAAQLSALGRGGVAFGAAFAGTISLAGQTLTSTEYDIVIGKINPGGAMHSVRRVGASGYDMLTGLIAHRDGRIAISAVFMGSGDVEGTPVQASGTSGRSTWVAEYAPSGAPSWVSTYTADGGVEYASLTASHQQTLAFVWQRGRAVFGATHVFDPGSNLSAITLVRHQR